MIIAIAAMEPKLDTQIAMHSARAPIFLLFDQQGNLIETIDNPFAEVERGAAPQIAQLLVGKGATKLIAGEFGPRFVSELEEKGISYVRMTGLISDVIVVFPF